MEKILNYIGGEFVPTQDWMENRNPATDEIYSQICVSGPEDAERAIAAAYTAQPSWSALGLQGRAQWLYRLADAIDERRSELARWESIDNGKPITASNTIDIPRSALNFRFFADLVQDLDEETYKMEGAKNHVVRKPLGVVTAISPWNLPLYLFTWKVAPALIMGNTVVGKPSEVTPMTAFQLAKICDEIGFPAGVFNIIHGPGANIGDTLIEDPRVKAITFTGSTATGRYINAKAGPLFKKTSLEMGGKNATIVFADCDFEKTVEETIRAAYSNQGQICLCGSRIYVESSIYERFRQALLEKMKELKVGDPLDESTRQGAIVSRPHFDKIMSYIELADKEGGQILSGGRATTVDGRGLFIEPTLIEGLANDSTLQRDEIFGPVATLTPFEDEDDAISLANATSYGLAGSVWTQDPAKGLRVAKSIDSGVFWINTWMKRDLRTPFGGVKDSGMGREGGHYALRFFSEPQNICIGDA